MDTLEYTDQLLRLFDWEVGGSERQRGFSVRSQSDRPWIELRLWASTENSDCGEDRSVSVAASRLTLAIDAAFDRWDVEAWDDT